MIGNHVIISEDLQRADQDAEKFKEGKNVVDVIRNITPLAMGVVGGQAQIRCFVTILIRWECTEDEFKSYAFQMRTLGKSN